MQNTANIGTNAVIYARFSSHNQREESIEQQVAECESYAKLNHLTVIDVYSDSAKTGKTDKRVQYQRLQRDAKKGKFQYIIAYKSNRIARNMFLALSFESEMEKYGVKVVYVKEEFGNNAAGRFALRTMMNVNQFYSENMAEDIKRGMNDNAEAGLSNGPLPYGYKRGENGKPVIDEGKADIVREIFKRAAAGTPIVHIANDLNMRGIKTKSGKPWGKNSFHSILNNERYTGVYLYSNVRVEGGMPQIVSKELFLKVQEHLKTKKNPQGRHTENGEYLLTGKLKCGHCNSFMMGMSGTGKSGKLHYYYSCQEARKHNCAKKNVRRDYIELEVAIAIRDYILQNSVMTWIADCVMKYQKENNNDTEIEMLQAQLSETKKSIENIMSAIEQGIFTNKTKQRLLDLEAEEKTLSNQLLLLKASKVSVSREQVMAWLNTFRTGNVESKSYQKLLFSSFLKVVYLYDDGNCKIVFDVGVGNQSITYDLITGTTEEDIAEGCSLKFPSASPEESQANTLCMIRGCFVLNYWLK